MNVSPSDLFDVVSDVSEYSRFVPYVSSSRVLTPGLAFPSDSRSKVVHIPSSLLPPLHTEEATSLKKVCGMLLAGFLSS